MAGRRIAFRAFGRFTWPNGLELPGSFEFFFDSDVGAGSIACVQWRPYLDILAGDQQAPVPLATLNGAALDSVKAGEAFSLSLEGPSPLRLVVPGAVILEQYDLKEDEPGLELRWMLARSFNQGNNLCHSCVVLGHRAGEAGLGIGFELQIAVPSPAPLGVIDGVGSGAFPFRVRYRARHDAPPSAPLKVDWVAAGAEGQRSECAWLDIRTGFDSPAFSSRVLGQFGFCPFQGGANYFYFPRDQDAKRAALWPTDRSRYAKETLSRFAAGAENLGRKIQVSSTFEKDEEFQSLWFSGKGAASKIYFRTTFRSSDKAAATTVGDLRITSNGIYPLDPFGVGNLMRHSATERWMRLDLIADWKIEDQDIVSIVSGEQDAQGLIAIRLGLQQQVDDADGTGTLQPEGGEFKEQVGEPVLDFVTFDKLADLGMRAMRLPRMGLDVLSTLEPANALPDMALKDYNGTRLFALAADVPFRVATRAISPDDSAPGSIDVIEWRNHPVDRARWPKADFGLRLWDYDKERGLEQDPGPLRVSFSLPGIDTAAGSKRAVFHATLLPDALIGDPARAGMVALNFGVDPQAPEGKAFQGRLGGLGLSAEKASVRGSPDDGEAGHWRFRPCKITEDAGRRIEILAGESDFQINLAIDRVEPLGVDIPWGDRSGRPRPLLLKDDAGEQGVSPYTLRLRERLSRKDDRQLSADILDGSAGKAQGSDQGVAPGSSAAAAQSRFVLLSEQPFSIMRFEAQSLATRGDIGNATIASYDSDSRQWSLRMTNRRYRYSLPPQGIGESMDKPGRLLILDSKNENEFGHFPDGPTAEGGALKRYGVEYRLTAPADLWIEPSDVDRNYFLPEWASHEIFRQRGDLGIGAALGGMRAEFLYGLALSVDPGQEKGAASATRVAEVEALLGRPPAKGEQTEGNRHWMRRWNRLADAVAHRPERLEFWMREPGTAQPFSPARFERGVRFSLRDRAVFRSPFAEEDLHARLTLHGLPGGALWPLESRAFCREFLNRPDSTGGTIDRIALSPHGGDADFRAEFLNGLLAIIAEVRGGRVQRQRVEIIGRIGTFWNRAKHVVLYDRTTCPSAQFTPDDGLGTATRRPVLRKVEEFVELLEPERFFPDASGSPAAATGFLHALRFNSKKIHVDSAWSEDVGESGWQIPLWNRHSAQRRPSVYPYPDIAFVLHAEGEEDRPLVAQECLDLDNLYFYSDAKAPNADTDRWAPVLTVDWINLPAPRAAQQPNLDAATPLDGDTRLPSAPRIPRGHRRFTWRLAPAGRRTRLNYGRGGQPLYAALDTMTFSRGANEEAPQASAVSETMTDISKALTLDPALSNASRAAFAALQRAAQIGDVASIEKTADDFKTALDPATWQAELDALKLPKIADLHALAKSAPDICHKLVDDFAASLDRKKQLMMAQLRAWLEHAEKIPSPAGLDRKKWVDETITDIMDAANPALGDLQADIGRLESDVARAQAVVSQFEVQLSELFDQARRKLAEIRRAYEDDKPWSPARIETYHARLEAVRAGLIGDITAAASEARTRLSTELGRLSHLIGTQIGKLLETATSAEGGILLALGGSENAALAVLTRLRGEYVAKIGAVRHPLAKAVKATKPGFPALSQRIEAAGGRLAAASRTLDEKLAKIEAGIRVRRVALAALITDEFDAFAKLIVPFAQQAQSVAADLAQIAEELADDPQLRALVASIGTETEALPLAARSLLEAAGRQALEPEAYYARLEQQIEAALTAAEYLAKDAFIAIGSGKKTIDDKLKRLKDSVSADFVTTVVGERIVRPAFDAIIPEAEFKLLQQDAQRVRERLAEMLAMVESRLSQADALAQDQFDTWKATAALICLELKVGIDSIQAAAQSAVEDALAKIQPLRDLANRIKLFANDAEKLAELVGLAQNDFKLLTHAVDDARVEAEAYVDRVLDGVGSITKGGLSSVPNNVLRLYAAAASAPALPNLDFARERLGYYYDALKSVIDTTPAEAWFGRLGSELKALGLSMPFQRIGDSLIPDDLSKLDIGRVFRNFGGIDLSGLFRGYRLPLGAGNAIRVTHNFDPKQARAWVKIDIDLQLPGRKSLFTVGPFSIDFVDSRLLATVRLEASKDTDKVEQTGQASLTTTVDSVVSGQSMVALEALLVQFEQGGGMKIGLDPKKIKLNPAFRFVQQTLGSLFPDEVGGLKLIKQNGLPIGIEHEFSMPPISIMGGISGVSNIAISNRFSLVAFPDFVIANRFALSRPDLPFLFTIFVIGGSGYITIDCEYRPFTSDLTVTVEAAAGGSAAFGFSLGPISGTVYVSLSIALAYRKQIGQPGGGLRISLVLLIAGNVDVAGIASVHLSLLLRMQYHENGRIDGVGTVSVSIRISRFYTYRFRRNANYTLRKGGGGSQPARLVAPRALVQGFAGEHIVAPTTSDPPSIMPNNDAIRRAQRILQARA